MDISIVRRRRLAQVRARLDELTRVRAERPFSRVEAREYARLGEVERVLLERIATEADHAP